jgi:hypothetical protein
MIRTECPNCGGAVTAFASQCPHCGMANKVRFAAIGIAAVAVILMLAIIVGAYFVMRSGPGGGRAATQDYGWLTTGMATCDADAEREQNVLHFMVIPLAMVTGDVASWRRVSLNDIGNAVLLPSDETMKGLQSGGLAISSDPYIFSVRDEKTSAIFKWSSSTGVKRFSTADADGIENFKLQFQTSTRKDDVEWGATFVRRKGNCYWVNAIVGG